MVKIVIISGPTASHKSHLAEKIRSQINVHSELVNIDSMQVYNSLPILTAIPENHAEYHLYAYKKYNEKSSAGIWLEDFENIRLSRLGKTDVFIVVGGTGLYIKSLIYGISEIPNVPREIRLRFLKKFEKSGSEEFFELIKKADPLAAEIIHPSDKQRMIRAMEVYDFTGKSIYSYHEKQKNQDNAQFLHLTILPERDLLYSNCNRRFDHMLNNGVIEEVKTLKSQINNESDIMVQNALGYKDICSYLDGVVSLDDAIEKAKQRTRNYAKRQVTWFKGQAEAEKLNFDRFDSRIESEVLQRVDKFLQIF